MNKNIRIIDVLKNPLMTAPGISAILVAAIKELTKIFPSLRDYSDLFTTLIPIASILLAYFLVWLFSKFYSLSFEQQSALTNLNSRRGRIKKELKNGDKYLTDETKEKLHKELNQISIEIATIGKINTKIDIN